MRHRSREEIGRETAVFDPCTACNGQGSVRCGSCGGSGKMSYGECPNCNGRGSFSCTRCGGMGGFER